MKRAILSVPAVLVSVSCLIVSAQDGPSQYYYKGNSRKMHVRATPRKKSFTPGTGRATKAVPGVLNAEALAGMTAGPVTGGRYFGWDNVVRSASTNTHSAPGGAPIAGGQIGLITRTFSVSPGTVMVPYVPPERAHMRMGRKHIKPYYTIDKWAPPY